MDEHRSVAGLATFSTGQNEIRICVIKRGLFFRHFCAALALVLADFRAFHVLNRVSLNLSGFQIGDYVFLGIPHQAAILRVGDTLPPVPVIAKGL